MPPVAQAPGLQMFFPSHDRFPSHDQREWFAEPCWPPDQPTQETEELVVFDALLYIRVRRIDEPA